MRWMVCVLALVLPGGATADPVSEIEACLAEAFDDMRGFDPAQCMGTISAACVQVSGDTTQGIAKCIAAETAAWDQVLNRTYTQVMAESRARDATGDIVSAELSREVTLRDAQRAWIAFRDAECTMWGARWGRDTMRPIAQANCLMEQTAGRTIDLLALREP